MASKPFVSVRKWIKWGDDPAGENTDTLVLTSASKYFVDTRIYLPTNISELSLPSTVLLPTSRLEWGFAGTAKSTPATYSSTGALEKPAHTQWTHWVDNKTLEEVKDEGVMYSVEGSDEVLEKGAMVNPSTGKVTEYEELWVDLDLVFVGGESRYQSWVLKTEKDGVRGVVIRIGEFAQAVLRKGGVVSVRRWKWVGGVWEDSLRIGVLESPLSNDELGRNIILGDEFRSNDGLIWKCVESFAWS